MSTNQSSIFNNNLFYWKMFGLWGGAVPRKSYRYYTIVFLLINLASYDILLTLNLIYTPRKVEFLIPEVIFYFTEVAVAAKVVMVLRMRKHILYVFSILDSEQFAGEEEYSRTIIRKSMSYFKTYYKLFLIVSNLCFALRVLFPMIFHLIFGTEVELPICKCYFLDQHIINKYFSAWYIYQSFGIYCHMLYNVNGDSLIVGLMLLALAQLKVLNYKFRSLKISKQHLQAGREKSRMREILEHYNLILECTAKTQHIISLTMFVQFGIASSIICVVLFGLTLPASTEIRIFMGIYFFLMMLEIFLPGWLGTHIRYESQALVFAAYQSDWISQSESFKRNIILFSQRANSVVQFRGLKVFDLSLNTFTSIIKTAYSLFALIRNVQMAQN